MVVGGGSSEMKLMLCSGLVKIERDRDEDSFSSLLQQLIGNGVGCLKKS